MRSRPSPRSSARSRSTLHLLFAAATYLSNACAEVPQREPLERPVPSEAVAEDAGAPRDGGRSELDASADATGQIELLGTTWLTTTSVVVRFANVSRVGDPFIAIYQANSPKPLSMFRVPFTGDERAASGVHAFEPLPVGTYWVRLVRVGNVVGQEVEFSVTEDSDGDGTADPNDMCPRDPNKQAMGACGCGKAETDADADGAADCVDLCPSNQMKVEPGVCGCDAADADLNGDGVLECLDECPADASKTSAGVCGCGVSEADADRDGTPDCNDLCASDGLKVTPGVCGCGVAESTTDTDGDFTPDCIDLCPTDNKKTTRGLCGCGVAEGTCANTCSSILNSETQMSAGEQRCSPNGRFTFGVETNGALTLRDGSIRVWSAFYSSAASAVMVRMQGDGNLVARSSTNTALWSSVTAGKTGSFLSVEDNGSVVLRQNGAIVWSIGPYQAGDTNCREARENQVLRAACPAGQVMNKLEFASYGKPTGVCGSYAVDTSCNYSAENFVQTTCVGKNSCEFLVDKATFTVPCSGAKRLLMEYTCATLDACPDDPLKVEGGQCGCGQADTDLDGDGTADCKDSCPTDSNKTVPGSCGCGTPDTDSDRDGTADCQDSCPSDQNKTSAGVCGCGRADTDSDEDAIADCRDQCPFDPLKQEPGWCGCGTAEDACPPPCSDELLGGDQMGVGDQRCSPDHRFTFGLDANGYVSLRDGNETVWSAYQQSAASSLKLQSDGNLVASSAASTPVWSSGTGGSSGTVLTVNDDGTVVMRRLDVVVWSIGPFQSGDSQCREARENQTIHLACPEGQTVSAIEFASYGKPTGTCGGYATDITCHYSAHAFVETKCIGENTCDFIVDAAKFTTPCSGQKRLAVEYRCASDDCPGDPAKLVPGVCGCGVPDRDTDEDGTYDCQDECPGDANKTAPGQCGCYVADTDTDLDTRADCDDECPDDGNKTDPGTCGCHVAETDRDRDGFADCVDACPEDARKSEQGVCGCGFVDADLDGNGSIDCVDACPDDDKKAYPGVCGCGTPDVDLDGDGVADCVDACPDDGNKTTTGICGCHVEETDQDNDGTLDCVDSCATDPNKTVAGTCGCGVPELDSDNDGALDCLDECPTDSNKTARGLCGCGAPETDRDGDTSPDCTDACPDDTNKTAAGACGCGTADTDRDGDATPDCQDACPDDLNKTVAGTCGCGVAEGTCAPPCSNTLRSTVAMVVDEKRCSTNGQFTFGIGLDGNVTLSENGDPVWKAYQTSGLKAAALLKMQSDGNLVARDSNNTSVWTSATQTKTGAEMSVEDNGSVVLRQNGAVVWTLGPYRVGDTVCREARENQLAHLSCPPGKVISTFTFSAYGKPTGTCGNYAIDATCNFSPQAYLDSNCVGKNTCDFVVDKAIFTIPCAGAKKLMVAYQCAAQ